MFKLMNLFIVPLNKHWLDRSIIKHMKNAIKYVEKTSGPLI